MNRTTAFRLHRDPFGRLVFTAQSGETHTGVVPVRAFPIAAPDEAIALVDPHGHELAWIDRLNDLPTELATLIDSELSSREFIPVIHRIINVSSFATPSTWQIDTDRGHARLVLKGEEDIRRLTSPALLIADSNGIHYLIRDRHALDAHSRRILDRFL